MRKLRACTFSSALLLLLLGLFSSCNEPVREYFEYWSSTCQVGKIEYISDNTELDGTPNLSALSQMEINLYLINPKGYEILTKPGGAPCFHFKDQNGSSTFYSEYSETAMDRNTTIKIRATFPDDTEGQTITLTGCIWPENRSSLGFSEDDLKESFPELFYTTTFVQNTPPDNVKNMNSSGPGDFYSGTRKHYLSFDIPNLGLKKNHGSRYEIKTYLRETDGELYYKGSETVSLDDSDPGNRTFLYYYAGQEDNLFYEYTVQVLGPHGLKSELLATDERLGVHQLTEPVITILNEFNGLEDEQGYKCIEVATNDDSISYTAAPAHEDDTLTVKVDDVEITDGNYTVSGIGQHTIEAISSKDGSRPISVTRKIRIVKTPDPATFTFASDDTTDLNGFNGFTDTNGFEYLEVPQSTSTVGYTISPTEEGTTVSGTVDGTEYSEPIDSETLDVGPHTLVAVIHKQYCNDVTTTRKIMVAKSLEAPVYTFTQKTNDKMVGEVEYIEVSSSTAKACYTIRPSLADSGAKVSGTVGSTSFAATTQKTGELAVNDYTFTVTVSKDYMIPRTFTKTIKVDSKLSKPSITFGTVDNGKSENYAGNTYEYFEVDNSSSKVTYTVTNSDPRGGSVSTIVTNMTNSSTVSTSNSGQLSTGRYKIEATVSKDGYSDVPATKYIVIVPKLKKPTITFNPTDNELGPDSNGYLYIEVSNSGSTITYNASTTDDGATVSVKINGHSNGSNLGTLGTGTYEVEVISSKPYHKDASIEKKIKVVPILQEPTYSFTPNLTGSKTGDYEWVEVPDGSTPVNYTITAEDGCTMVVKDSVDNSNHTTAGNTYSENFVSLSTLSEKDHILTVKVSKQFYTDQTYYKYIKVVKAIQEPSYSFTPGLTSESGDKWIEVPKDNHNVSCTITANASGEKIKVTEGGNTLYNTGSSPATFTLSTLGDHTLTITVTKDKYETKTFSKTIKIVEELQKPTIKFYKESGHSTQINKKSGNPEDARFLLYDTYNITLASDGTGYLYYTATTSDGSTITIKDDGTTTTSGKLGLGPHNLTMEVSKTNYVTRTFDTPEKVYVEGLLAAPTFTPVGTKTKTDTDGTEHWQFSYISYDEMPVNVTPGNTGNTVKMYIDGHEVSEATIGHNTAASITVVQTREHCKRREDDSPWMSVTIKPITLTYEAGKYTDGLQVEVQGFGGNSGENMCIRGQIYVKGPNTDKLIWHFEGDYQTVTRNQWSTICDTGDPYKYWSDTFTSPSDTIQVTFYKFRRDKEGTDIQFSGNDWHSFPALTLSDIKKGKGENSTAGTSWTYVCDIANRSGDCARPKIRFTATE